MGSGRLIVVVGASPGAGPEVSIGAVSFLHRFGSSLNTHFHYHLLVLDGVFSEGADATVRFHEASALTQEHWQGLQATVQRRVLRYFHRHNLVAPLRKPQRRDLATLRRLPMPWA